MFYSNYCIGYEIILSNKSENWFHWPHPTGRVDPRTVLMMVTFSLTCVFCIGVMFFGWFKHLIPQLQLRMGKVNLCKICVLHYLLSTVCNIFIYRSTEFLVRQDQVMKRKVMQRKTVKLLRWFVMEYIQRYLLLFLCFCLWLVLTPLLIISPSFHTYVPHNTRVRIFHLFWERAHRLYQQITLLLASVTNRLAALTSWGDEVRPFVPPPTPQGAESPSLERPIRCQHLREVQKGESKKEILCLGMKQSI